MLMVMQYLLSSETLIYLSSNNIHYLKNLIFHYKTCQKVSAIYIFFGKINTSASVKNSIHFILNIILQVSINHYYPVLHT